MLKSKENRKTNKIIKFKTIILLMIILSIAIIFKLGQKDNIVMLTEFKNPAGFQDAEREDNSDMSSVLVTIATGLDRNDRIVIIGIVQIVLVITIGLLLSYEKKEKHKKK